MTMDPLMCVQVYVVYHNYQVFIVLNIYSASIILYVLQTLTIHNKDHTPMHHFMSSFKTVWREWISNVMIIYSIQSNHIYWGAIVYAGNASDNIFYLISIFTARQCSTLRISFKMRTAEFFVIVKFNMPACQ